MSDTLRRICFANAPFRVVKGVFFHRWVLWSIGVALAVGLPLALVGVAVDRIGVVVAGLLLTLPFQLWVGLLVLVCFLLAVPRLLVLGVALGAVYCGLPGLGKRLAEWAGRYEEPSSSGEQPTEAGYAGSQASKASGGGAGG